MSTGVVFRRIGSKIIPIRAGAGAAKTAVAAKVGKDAKPIKTREGAKALSTAVSVASGALAGATLFRSAKVFALGQSLSLGLDVGAAALNVTAHAGKGNTKGRVKAAAKHEALNNVLGYATFGAVALANPKARAKLVEYGSKAFEVGKAFAGKMRF